MQLDIALQSLIDAAGEAAVEGAADGPIRGIAGLGEARPGDLSFLGNKKYTDQVPASEASFILLPKTYRGNPKTGQVYLRVDNPSLVLGRFCAAIEASLWPAPAPGIHPSAVIDDSARVDPQAHVGPGCVIADGASVGPGCVLKAQVHVGVNARVGASCYLFPHVYVGDYCILGDRVRINAGAVIGSDGYGFEAVEGVHEKVPQVGNVVIGDDVEIGANTTVDRARFSSTIIGNGTKIDNLVQIGHNVVTGRNCLIVSQTGISGSTVLEDSVILAGQCGVVGHLRLGRGSIVGAQGGVHSNTEPGVQYLGAPALPAMQTNRILALRKRLPELFKRVSALEKQLGIEINSKR